MASAGSQLSILKVETIGIVDAHGYGKRFIVRGDEIRTGTANGDTCVRGEFDAEKLTAGFGTGFATYQDAARCTTTPFIFD